MSGEKGLSNSNSAAQEGQGRRRHITNLHPNHDQRVPHIFYQMQLSRHSPSPLMGGGVPGTLMSFVEFDIQESFMRSPLVSSAT